MKNIKVFTRFFSKNVRLEKEEHENETFNEIAENANFSGYNLWVLGFAMIIACIGLNTDSMSAIIGAMLISPLMGPIVGYAFALAINDKSLKNASIRNWIWMTIISLFASTLFFIISPFDNDTAVLLSFTKASIFDILIAFFGGMAGFLGIMKRDGVKVMAGVAVATACMPPLCTAGFGLAHANWMEFFGGLYFYIINCLFIGLATFLLARFNRFHFHFRNENNNNKIDTWLWSLFIIAMIIPASYIAWQKWLEEKNPWKEKNISDKQRILILEKKVEQLDSLLNFNNNK
ncbi:MAG: DUF389 domain-containing protein [Chitinophagaceae bacterium]|nr:DUF389 domain-containing protein [Chitinophagaceae bacterium]